jgi:ubiquinone/menaquinone biosynthesis C-methylase UbiE
MSEQTLTDSFYARWARLYDRLAVAPVVRGWRERAAEALDVTAGDTVVDMGCGTGANAPALRERVGADGRILCVDLVPEMLARAQRRSDRHGWTNVHLVRGDATRPPVREADALVSTFVVGMFADPAAVVRSWLQCVKPGGRIALLNLNRSQRLGTAPLNALFRGFVRVGAPGDRWRLRSPTRQLEQRCTAAREALFEGTVDQRTETLAGGYVTLASGRVPE